MDGNLCSFLDAMTFCSKDNNKEDVQEHNNREAI